MMATGVLAPPFRPSWSCRDWEGPFAELDPDYCAACSRSAHTGVTLTTTMPITVSSMDDIHTVIAEYGGNASIQRQLITPSTPVIS